MTLLRDLTIPRMGSVENARLVSWRVAEGARFVAGAVLCDVETDKTLTEVEADGDGILARQLAAEGDELKVGDLIGLVADSGSSLDAITEALRAREYAAGRSVPAEPDTSARSVDAAQPATTGDASRAAEPTSAAAKLSPYARRLARERGVELSTTRGTGPGGRITGDDVLQASVDAATVSGAAASSELPGYDGIPVDREAHSTRRRAIARRLAESARTAPHLTADMQVDMTALLAARQRSKTSQSSPVSMLGYIAHATAQLLKRHPKLNAAFTDSHLLRWQVVNLGIAVDTPEGLVVPVIRGAEDLSLAQVSSAIGDLATRGRAGTLRSAELEGGTFTISNPGSLGPVLRAEAILNPPQVALLGLPAMIHAPVAVETSPQQFAVEVRPLLRPSLTFDHRALDGGDVIRFLNDFKAMLEAL